jgi:hypothetical protein
MISMKSPPTPSLPPICIDEPTAATALGVSARTLFEWRKKRLVPFIAIGGRIVYSVAALERWALERSTPPTAEDARKV